MMRASVIVCGLLFGGAVSGAGWAQADAAAGDPVTPESQALSAQLQVRGEDFFKTVEAAGYKPILPRPAIVVQTTPMLSNYSGQKKNVIAIPQWEALGTDVQAAFSRFAAGAGEGMSGKQFFDQAFHRFFFIHEIGHWLEAQSEGFTSPKVYKLNRYVHELDANRIAVAYWREKDPAFLDEEVREFRAVYAILPSPVPAGGDPVKFFTEHYAELTTSPAYAWYQMRLVIEAADEKPRPTLAQLLKELPGLTYE